MNQRRVQARDLVESRSAAVRQVERHLDLVRSRYENGTAVRSDVLTVELREAEVREGLITATNQLELAWAVLENAIGCRVPRVLPEAGEPATWSGRVGAVEEAIAEAVARRPELGTARSRTRGAAHDVDAARAGKRPRVDVLGNFGTFDINSGSGGNGLVVGLIASVNLFDDHRTKAQVARASARVRELQVASHGPVHRASRGPPPACASCRPDTRGCSWTSNWRSAGRTWRRGTRRSGWR